MVYLFQLNTKMNDLTRQLEGCHERIATLEAKVARLERDLNMDLPSFYDSLSNYSSTSEVAPIAASHGFTASGHNIPPPPPPPPPPSVDPAKLQFTSTPNPVFLSSMVDRQGAKKDGRGHSKSVDNIHASCLSIAEVLELGKRKKQR